MMFSKVRIKYWLTVITVLFIFLFPVKSQYVRETILYKRLKSYPGIDVKQIQPGPQYNEAYEILFKQPVDHDNPEGETFKQRILLSHIKMTSPVILITEGYELQHNYINELSQITAANEIRVEHRYYGESKPSSLNWKYLNIKQAAADIHRIASLFRRIYWGKWISSGWSKGGQTALIYRWLYPDDVDATIAYDAPVNFALEEPRIDSFFLTVGTEFCR